MRQVHRGTVRALVTSGLGIGLVIFVLAVLLVTSTPAQADTQVNITVIPAQKALPPVRPPGQGQTDEVLITATAQTQKDPSNGLSVSAGDYVTYNITIRNTSQSAQATAITITDQLLALLDPKCLTSTSAISLTCQPVTTSLEISVTKDTTDTIIITDKVQWTTPALGPGQSAAGRFKAKAVCQPDNTILSNFAVLKYTLNGTPRVRPSGIVNTRLRVDPTAAAGRATISSAPTWCSSESGAFYDMDWGDYDGDGDLDAVMVSSSTEIGVVVYRNDGNQFTRLAPVYNGLFLKSARWADFDNDGRLDLLVTGYWDDIHSRDPSGEYNYTGYNYIFLNDGGDGFDLVLRGWDSSGEPYTFQSNDGIFRAAVADYDNDGWVDVALGNQYNISNGCAIQVNRNRGGSDYFVTVLTDTSVWQLPNRNLPNPNLRCLLQKAKINGLAWGDYDNDGLLDLAAAVKDTDKDDSDRVLVFKQVVLFGARVFAEQDPIEYSPPPPLNLTPYDVRWGDYDNDGYLDLAVALGDRVHIYNNNSGTLQVTGPKVISAFSTTVRAIDWVDFDGDGQLELAVADRPPKIYDNLTGDPSAIVSLPSIGSGSIYAIRGVDGDNDGDRDIAYTNFYGKGLLFTALAPYLAQSLTEVDEAAQGTGVAWGAVSRGGLGEHNDLLLSATGPMGSRLYKNNNGQFSQTPYVEFLIPSNAVAFGDLDADGDLDIAAGSNGQNQIYRYDGAYSLLPGWLSTDGDDSRSLVFGDFDQDNSGLLELIVANSNARSTFYRNEGLQSGASSPTWWSVSEDSRSIAWGYYDDGVYGDGVLPDFAVGNYGQPSRVYRNNGNNTFSLVTTWNPTPANTRSVAWGDYDGDGDMDLAVGNYGQPNYIYENQGGNLGQTPVWSSTEAFNTTSLAWGDWDNDGDLDLAMGNDNGDPDQVYANLGSNPGSPRLSWLWQSNTISDTQGVAWGDVDGDGDLDLAIAGQNGSGYYENIYVAPAHSSLSNMPLPLNSSYLSITRPVPAEGRIWYRTTLDDPGSLVIPIEFTVYDPDGWRQNGCRNTGQNACGNDQSPGIAGDYAAKTTFEYSVDGGSDWQPATGNSPPTYSPDTQSYTFRWQAGNDLSGPDSAVSDDVRIRVSVIHENKGGLLQRARTSAVSPPFRVRNLECVWPEDAFIGVEPAQGQVVKLTGSAIGGGNGPLGQIFYEWDFGDAITWVGVITYHRFTVGGSRVVSLTVKGQPCPVTRPDFVTSTVTGAALDKRIYLPLILKGGPGVPSTDVTTFGIVPVDPNLARVTDLLGYIQPDGTDLRWNPGSQDDSILGYRIYRARMGETSFALVQDVPASVTTYTDGSATCGQMYFVTVYSAKGESLPSTSSYFSQPCR